MYIDPTLNGVPVNIFMLEKEASPHPFRTRVLIREEAYVEIGSNVEMQVHFFTKESLRWRNSVGRDRSLGYVWTLAGILQNLGITPIEDEWVRYRLQFPGLGTNYYLISGVTPKSHLDGEWLYYRLDFSEDNSSDSISLDEQDAEQLDNSMERLVELPNE